MARSADAMILDGEYVVYRTRRHLVAWLHDARFGFLSLALALVMLIVAMRENDPGVAGAFLGWVAASLFFGGFACTAWTWFGWYQADYVITNRRVMKVDGIANRKAVDLPLEKVKDVVLAQSVLGRMLDFGEVEILTETVRFADHHRLHHAPLFKKWILQQKQDLEEAHARKITAPIHVTAQADAEAAAVSPRAPTVEDKLRQLAALRDQGLITPDDYEATKTAILALM
jgi:uncharacterized membrane protein YdbT with pleckstrin-like domain